jgi:hypothetical protein
MEQHSPNRKPQNYEKHTHYSQYEDDYELQKDRENQTTCSSTARKREHNTTGNARINVTMRRVRVTIVAVERQYVLHTRNR